MMLKDKTMKILSKLFHWGHWAMMGAMLFTGASMALGAHGAATNFGHIIMSHMKHMASMTADIMPGLKSIGVAFGNLLGLTGLDTSALTAVDPAMVESVKHAHAGHGAVEAASGAVKKLSSAPASISNAFAGANMADICAKGQVGVNPLSEQAGNMAMEMC